LKSFYPAIRMRLVTPSFFFSLFFFGDHLPQTSGFLWAKQILITSFATQARTCILSDHNIFYTPKGGRTTARFNAPGAFLVFRLKNNCLNCYALRRSFHSFHITTTVHIYVFHIFIRSSIPHARYKNPKLTCSQHLKAS